MQDHVFTFLNIIILYLFYHYCYHYSPVNKYFHYQIIMSLYDISQQRIFVSALEPSFLLLCVYSFVHF